MAYWRNTNQELDKDLAGKAQFVQENLLVQAPDIFPGPTANAVKRAFGQLMADVKLTDMPWATGAEAYVGIGPNNTYWVLDPNSDQYGIWVLNASSAEAAKNAQQASAVTQYGYYARAVGSLPTMTAIKESGLVFGKGFSEAFYKNHPNQDDRPKAPPKRPVVPVRTFEMFGLRDGLPVPLFDVLKKAGPGDYVVEDGVEIVIGDSEADGFRLAGDPGRWSAFYPGRSPADFGLDADKAVLRWDPVAQKGVVMPAALLDDMYKPENWRRKVYP